MRIVLRIILMAMGGLLIYLGIKWMIDAHNGDSTLNWILSLGGGPTIILGGGILAIFMLYHLIAFKNEPADYHDEEDKPRRRSSSTSTHHSSSSSTKPQRMTHLKDPHDD